MTDGDDDCPMSTSNPLPHRHNDHGDDYYYAALAADLQQLRVEIQQLKQALERSLQKDEFLQQQWHSRGTTSFTYL